jgi:hypothetical protein
VSENTSPSPETLAASPTPLLNALRSLLLSHRDAFKQERTFLRMQAHLFGHLFCFARRTVTQAHLALVHDQETFWVMDREAL